MTLSKAFRYNNSIELDFIKKGICPFCKRKVDISEYKDIISLRSEYNNVAETLTMIKKNGIKHLRKNKRCIFQKGLK